MNATAKCKDQAVVDAHAQSVALSQISDTGNRCQTDREVMNSDKTIEWDNNNNNNNKTLFALINQVLPV